MHQVTVVYTVNGTVLTDEITGELRSTQLSGAASDNSTGVVLVRPGTLRRPDRPNRPVSAAYYRNAEVIYVADAADVANAESAAETSAAEAERDLLGRQQQALLNLCANAEATGRLIPHEQVYQLLTTDPGDAGDAGAVK